MKENNGQVPFRSEKLLVGSFFPCVMVFFFVLFVFVGCVSLEGKKGRSNEEQTGRGRKMAGRKGKGGRVREGRDGAEREQQRRCESGTAMNSAVATDGRGCRQKGELLLG